MCQWLCDCASVVWAKSSATKGPFRRTHKQSVFVVSASVCLHSTPWLFSVRHFDLSTYTPTGCIQYCTDIQAMLIQTAGLSLSILFCRRIAVWLCPATVHTLRSCFCEWTTWNSIYFCERILFIILFCFFFCFSFLYGIMYSLLFVRWFSWKSLIIYIVFSRRTYGLMWPFIYFR